MSPHAKMNLLIAVLIGANLWLAAWGARELIGAYLAHAFQVVGA